MTKERNSIKISPERSHSPDRLILGTTGAESNNNSNRCYTEGGQKRSQITLTLHSNYNSL